MYFKEKNEEMFLFEYGNKLLILILQGCISITPLFPIKYERLHTYHILSILKYKVSFIFLCLSKKRKGKKKLHERLQETES